MYRSAALCALFPAVLAVPAPRALGQPPTPAAPTLRYDPPSGFGGGGDGVELWVADNLDGVIGVYPFRPFRGELQREFQRTLLADRVAAPYREDRLLAPPAFGLPTIRGADAAISARFSSYNLGAPREHLRVAVLAAGAVAIVDVSANGPQAYARNWPGVLTMLNSLGVVPGGVAAATPAPPGARGAASVAGLYVGMTRSLQLNVVGPPGSGTWVNRNQWYLLSPDGRVHRGYDLPAAPDGDVRRFDYERARRTDPGNAGAYALQGGRLILRLGNPPSETIDASVTAVGELVIHGTTYRRVQLR